MKKEDFAKKCFENRSKDEMLPDGTNAQEGLEILIKHFLGYEYIVTGYSCGTAQWNSEAIYTVLNRYPEGSIRKIPKEKSIIKE